MVGDSWILHWPARQLRLGVRWRGRFCVTPQASSRARWEKRLMWSGDDESRRVWVSKGEEGIAVSRREVGRERGDSLAVYPR